MKERQIIEVSSEHKVLRTVLFAAAFVIAIGSIAFGLISYTKKTPGWQEATARIDREFPNYSRNFHTLVYLDGSSGEIRDKLLTFNKIYSDNLMRVYKLLDCEVPYENYYNLATVNLHLGSKIKISEDLYSVLQDAYKRTLEGSYNLFAGPLYRAKELIANSDNYDEEWEQVRLSALETALNDLSNFTVEFMPDNYIMIDVSDSYLALLDQYEFNYPIVDFGENYYFYKTVMMDRALSENGYSGCLFYSD